MTVAGKPVSVFEAQDLITEVRRDREDLARVLKKHKGIRKIVEDLYPDSAHFLYELLQNAEDTGATEVDIILEETRLIFEHNGRPFEKKDIYGITDIGAGTKSDDDETIGRFGVGFKAVFAYSDTPHIWSPTVSFKIDDLVLPYAITPRADIGKRTRFEFPFNNPKNPAALAYKNVEYGLHGLAETALLFLSHLQCVGWRTSTGGSGQIMRIRHSNNHVEVMRESTGEATGIHFLLFEQRVPQLETQRVAIAFALDFLLSAKAFKDAEPLSKQFRIAEAHGSVAVYFPAEKEISGLRFHLHAPFVPELSRASIKETTANKPLFDQLAALTTSSLHEIRNLGLLTADFLAVLPNSQDPIPPRYQVIRDSVIIAMNTVPLTPTHDKSHAAARYLIQANASLKALLPENDIEYLVDYDDEPPHWAVAATQKNTNVDRFLGSLSIKDWGIEEFADLISAKTSEAAHYRDTEEPDAEFMAWLAAKPTAWHQQFYALLYSEFAGESDLRRFEDCQIVRLSDGSYTSGGKCFFPDGESSGDQVVPRVDAAVYNSGKSKPQQHNAKKFLEEIGVRVVGETEQVELILGQRYTQEAELPDEETYVSDMKRFIALVEKEPRCATLFKRYYIFECDDEQWRIPSEVYIDEPFRETGLRAFFEALGDKAEQFSLSARYANIGIEPRSIAEFAKSTGARTALAVSAISTRNHPQSAELRIDYNRPGTRWTDSAIDRDWTLPGLTDAFKNISLRLSLLIWKTMSGASSESLEARFRPNQQYEIRRAPSSLVLFLQNSAWIPQGSGLFVKPSQASRDLLPPGFLFDAGQPWLRSIKWGDEVVKRSEHQRQKEALAKELGFADVGTLDRARRFAALPSQHQERILAELDSKAIIALPEHRSSNPDRRAEGVAAKAATSPDRLTEQRTRSVSVGRELVKEEAAKYLWHQYMSDGHVICQICKGPMPFKLDDGSDYFEKVEFLPELKKRHFQNYLALCPNHAAMFKEANGCADILLEMFADLSGNQLEVVLAQADASIYFTQTHIADLKVIIKVDQAAGSSDADPAQSNGEGT